MLRIMLFSINRPIPLKIMHVLITFQVKSALFAAATPHPFHRISPVGGGKVSFYNSSPHADVGLVGLRRRLLMVSQVSRAVPGNCTMGQRKLVDA